MGAEELRHHPSRYTKSRQAPASALPRALLPPPAPRTSARGAAACVHRENRAPGIQRQRGRETWQCSVGMDTAYRCRTRRSVRCRTQHIDVNTASLNHGRTHHARVRRHCRAEMALQGEAIDQLLVDMRFKAMPGPMPACQAIASSLRNMGASGAPEAVRMRQVEAMFDRVPGICLQ